MRILVFLVSLIVFSFNARADEENRILLTKTVIVEDITCSDGSDVFHGEARLRGPVLLDRMEGLTADVPNNAFDVAVLSEASCEVLLRANVQEEGASVILQRDVNDPNNWVIELFAVRDGERVLLNQSNFSE